VLIEIVETGKQLLITRGAENSTAPIPVDLVTASGSGLNPHISPATAEFSIPRVAREWNMNPDELCALVRQQRLDGSWAT